MLKAKFKSRCSYEMTFLKKECRLHLYAIGDIALSQSFYDAVNRFQKCIQSKAMY